ncbi:MAG: hypothetical protein HY304_09365 [candidate division Zixibacteria bacterium]|nr:hypothetical protein [candidate division Zixibacteria bacterium]
MFTEADIETISSCLQPIEKGFETDHYRLKLVSDQDRRVLVVELYPETRLGRNLGSTLRQRDA